MKLGEPGYKERYYAEKLNIDEWKSIDDVRKDVVSHFLSLRLSYFTEFLETLVLKLICTHTSDKAWILVHESKIAQIFFRS